MKRTAEQRAASYAAKVHNAADQAREKILESLQRAWLRGYESRRAEARPRKPRKAKSHDGQGLLPL